MSEINLCIIHGITTNQAKAINELLIENNEHALKRTQSKPIHVKLVLGNFNMDPIILIVTCLKLKQTQMKSGLMLLKELKTGYLKLCNHPQPLKTIPNHP